MLAMTKRTGVLNMDTSQGVTDQGQLEQKLARWAFLRDNYGTRVLGLDEVYSQSDTTLTDLDAVIMTQYQIVAAIAEVPAVKLLGTSPKGFGASGEYETQSYHEMLQSVQTDEMEPVLDRHHMLLIKSEIAPNAPFATSITWMPLDVPTSEQKALLNKGKAETDVLLASTGAIDGKDIRERIIADPESDYSGISAEVPEQPEEEFTPNEALHDAEHDGTEEEEGDGGGI